MNTNQHAITEIDRYLGQIAAELEQRAKEVRDFRALLKTEDADTLLNPHGSAFFHNLQRVLDDSARDRSAQERTGALREVVVAHAAHFPRTEA